MQPSATVALNERSNQLRSEGKQVFKLGLGQSPFPVPSSVVEQLRAHAHEKDYLPVCGLRELREAVADYHRRLDGTAATGDDVLVGPGSKELMFLLQLVYYGDLVIPTPSWVSYAPQAEIIGRRVRWVPTQAEDGWKMTARGLQDICADDSGRPRIVILNYPNNPTGSTYSPRELEAIAKVARRHQVLLLSDEIYGQLHYEGAHVSIARYYPEGTIISSGLSKWCGAGGWRLGYFLYPQGLGWLRDAMAVVASETYTSTSAPVQHAAIRAFRGGADLERYLTTARRILSVLGRFCTDRLRAAGLEVPTPVGGFYLFADFAPVRERLARRGIDTSQALCERLLDETGIAILPGSSFGRPEQELTARIAFVDFDGARALSAADSGATVDDEFLVIHCPNVVSAIDRLTGWVAIETIGSTAPRSA